MAEKPTLDKALELILSLSYPPTTLSLPPEQAVGHRLAKAVIARGNQPTRPFALVDGLAVLKDDVLVPTGNATSEPAKPAEESDLESTYIEEDEQTAPHEAADEQAAPRDAADEQAGASDTPALDDTGADEAEPPVAQDVSEDVQLALRPFPETNRKEEALTFGQAIPVQVGGEVPRGGDFVYPFASFVSEYESTERKTPVPAPPEPAPPDNDQAAESEPEEGIEDLPAAEPSRDWELATRYLSGQVELKRLARPAETNMVQIGGWARNREVVVAERTIIRAGELAMLSALGIEEVEVYRRPVVGVASLSPPFPEAGKEHDRQQQRGACPLQRMAVALARASRVAALPLGFAPLKFRALLSVLKRWMRQVDILLLVGGSHHGPECLGLDVLRAIGDVSFSGVELTPGSSLSAGKVLGRPLVVMPGTLPDVLVGFALLVRPLAHKYLTPHLYNSTIELVLERGAELGVAQDTAVPVRFGFDRQREAFCTRYAGQRYDPWLDWIRGQAVVVLEAGKRYEDGERVTAHLY